MRFGWLVAFSLVSTQANAFCSEGFGYDFADQVNDKIQYLVCLHNEQTDRLNEQADTINAQSRAIEDLEHRLSQANDALEELQSKLGDIESALQQ